MADEILRVEDLSLVYRNGSDETRVLNNVSFSMKKGETLGIVGESGCGKSTLAKAINRVLPSAAEITGGKVLYNGNDLLKLGNNELRSVRGSEIGMIFQNPMTALNPTMKLKSQMFEVLRKKGLKEDEMMDRAVELYRKVGIPAPEKRLNEYIQEYSGGMRQRAMIALVLASEPKLLIADEPTTALDVTIQHQIIELIRSLVSSSGMSLILISHDFGVVSELCSRINVMYAGRIVESADRRDIFADPQHPYTQALLGSIPSAGSGKRLDVIEGMPPDLRKEITGCAFAERCRYACDDCRSSRPELTEITDGHFAACLKRNPSSGSEKDGGSDER